jgi:hypothetical protein
VALPLAVFLLASHPLVAVFADAACRWLCLLLPRAHWARFFADDKAVAGFSPRPICPNALCRKRTSRTPPPRRPTRPVATKRGLSKGKALLERNRPMR